MSTVFISYRRDTGGEFASLIEKSLSSIGFSVFLDHKSLHAGRFDEEIKVNINIANDFVLVLSERALDERNVKQDFYFDEIRHAISLNKHIILVIMNSFAEPKQLPTGLEDILKYNAVYQKNIIDFDSVFIPSLINSFAPSEDKERYDSTHQNFTRLLSRKLIEREPLSDRWSNAKTIKICAYFSNQIFASDLITPLLKSGASFQFLIVDPESDSAREFAENRLEKLPRTTLNSFRHAYDDILDILAERAELKECEPDNPIFNGSIVFKKTSLYIFNAIMIVEKKVLGESTVKVDLYTFKTNDTERRSMLIPFSDRSNYEFFSNQFDYIWNHPSTKEITLDGEKN